MAIVDFNHYFVRVSDLERSRRFYCDVLGFEEMPRPDFPFPGYWLGVNGKILVHMGQHGIPGSEQYYIGTRPDSATDNSGIVDHVAFLTTEPENTMRRMEQLAVPFHRRYIAEIRFFQMVIRDPDGLCIELNFPEVAVEPS